MTGFPKISVLGEGVGVPCPILPGFTVTMLPFLSVTGLPKMSVFGEGVGVA